MIISLFCRQQLYEHNAFLEPPNQLELDSGGSNFKVRSKSNYIANKVLSLINYLKIKNYKNF